MTERLREEELWKCGENNLKHIPGLEKFMKEPPNPLKGALEVNNSLKYFLFAMALHSFLFGIFKTVKCC